MAYYSGAPSLAWIDFLDQAGAPATLGRMQRNGDLTQYFEGTNALFNSGFIYVNKGSNETVNNSTTLQNDDALLWAVGINEVWEMFMWVNYTSSTVADFKYQIDGPASAVGDWSHSGYSTALALNNGGNLVLGTPYSLGGAGAIDLSVFIQGKIATAGTGGNIQFTWAQNALEASNTVVYAGSTLIALRVA